MHIRLGSATLLQQAFPGESYPNFPWEKSHWDNTVEKKNTSKLDPSNRMGKEVCVRNLTPVAKHSHKNEAGFISWLLRSSSKGGNGSCIKRRESRLTAARSESSLDLSDQGPAAAARDDARDGSHGNESLHVRQVRSSHGLQVPPSRPQRSLQGKQLHQQLQAGPVAPGRRWDHSGPG